MSLFFIVNMDSTVFLSLFIIVWSIKYYAFNSVNRVNDLSGWKGCSVVYTEMIMW